MSASTETKAKTRADYESDMAKLMSKFPQAYIVRAPEGFEVWSDPSMFGIVLGFSPTRGGAWFDAVEKHRP